MKTPKRYPATMSVYATIEHLRQDRARWKRKNRVKQLKNTIRKMKDEMEDLNRSRVILRNRMICQRNAYILRARKAGTEDARKLWLASIREHNLFLQLTMSRDEMDAQGRGEDVMPHALKLTEEEQQILHEIILNCRHADDNATEAE